MCFIKTACTLAFTVPPPHTSSQWSSCRVVTLSSSLSSHTFTQYTQHLSIHLTHCHSSLIPYLPPLKPTLSTPCVRTSSSTPPLHLQILSLTFPTTLTISFFFLFSLSTHTHHSLPAYAYIPTRSPLWHCVIHPQKCHNHRQEADGQPSVV